MIDPAIVWAGALVTVAAMLCWAGLRAWRGWIDLQKLRIASRRGGDDPAPQVRIEVADLKERLRKLEAIAKGVDL